MAGSQTKDRWDAAAEEAKWRQSMEKGHKFLERLGEQFSKSNPDFYVLSLAELDAANHFTRPACFSSREAFIRELKRLIGEPTEPSRVVPSVQAYRDSQKWWLESLLRSYESKS
jgi:hypothetical protein